MLKLIIGEEAFRKGMDLYFQRCDGTAAVVEDFLACFEEASKRDLTQFKRWYTQAGTPRLKVTSHYDAAAQRLTLDFEQSTAPTNGQSEKYPVVIPVALGLMDENGSDIALTTPPENAEGGARADEKTRGVFEITQNTRRIIFEKVARRPVPSLLRGFSAPVNLDTPLSDDDLLTLLAHDRDMFNRWQAAQTCATRWMIRAVDAVRHGGTPDDAKKISKALAAVLASYEKDPAFTAQAMILPSESDLAREIGQDVDPDAVHYARKILRAQIGRTLDDDLERVYHALATNDAYSPDAASAGRRALRNATLDLLAAGAPNKGSQLASAQFRAANNMTDQIGALNVLALIPGDAREAALDSFFRAHASDPLVIDKWFALQAMIPEEATLARIKRLMNHHAFSLTNPNRLRSLIGAFATGNLTRFNAADGSGYDLLVETVIAVDPKNPQVAARLLAAFRSWRSLESGRKALAEAALQRVAAVQDLSADVRDIAQRSLGV
jgi:aminopeptidase N